MLTYLLLGKVSLPLTDVIAKLPNTVTLDVGESLGSLVDPMENFTIMGARCIEKTVGE